MKLLFRNIRIGIVAFLLITISSELCISQMTGQTDSGIQNVNNANKKIASEVESELRASFFNTFLKTPFIFFTAIITFLGCVFSCVFEVWGYLFSGFDYKFPVTKDIWELGWNNIVRDWWKDGVTWHLILSTIFWFGFFSAAGKNRR